MSRTIDPTPDASAAWLNVACGRTRWIRTRRRRLSCDVDRKQPSEHRYQPRVAESGLSRQARHRDPTQIYIDEPEIVTPATPQLSSQVRGTERR
jgi:hypothetical protein